MNINLTLIGQTISFFFFVWFCMKYVWPPLINAMQERKEKIADGLAAVERGKHEQALAEERAKDDLKKAKEQAAEILAKAERRASEIRFTLSARDNPDLSRSERARFLGPAPVR